MDYVLKKGSIYMYLTMAFIGCIIFPYAVIAKGITLKNPPFRVVVVGTIYAVCGALLAIGMGSICGVDMSGAPEIEKMVEGVTSNEDALKQLGIADISKKEQTSQLTAYYGSMFELLPTLFFVFGAVVSYLEYILISRKRARKGKEVIPMTPINEFNLDKSALVGWLTLLLVAYVIYTGEGQYAHMIYVNVLALFGYSFAVQGISLIFHHAKMKRLKKVFPVLLSACLLIMGKGMYILLAFGLVDLIFGLKGKIKAR